MGLFDFLINDEKKDLDLFKEEGKSLGLSEEEIEEARLCGISPQEWLKENDPENYYDQDLDDE